MEILEIGIENAQEITKYYSVSVFYSKVMKSEPPTNIGARWYRWIP